MGNKGSIQYSAGVSASLGFLFTGAVLSWPSPALLKFHSGETGIEISDVGYLFITYITTLYAGSYLYELLDQGQLSWVVSLALVGALIGCFAGQYSADGIGRVKTIYASAAPGFLGSAMIMFTKIPEIIYIGRILQGASTGMIAVVTMIYITEISDKETRGALGMVVQVMNNLGSLLIYAVGPYVSYTVLNGIVLGIPVIFVAFTLWLPESPYYYLKQGKDEKAKDVFEKLTGSNDEKVTNERLVAIRLHVRESMENKSTYSELFSQKYRKALYVVAGLKVVQYMTGNVAIQAYLGTIFYQSSSMTTAYASIIYGVVQLAAGIVATILPLYIGKRVLMMLSCFGITISMTVLGLFFYAKTFNLHQEIIQNITFVPLIALLGFNILYAIGIGNLPYVMQAELFPLNVKSTASSMATISACILSFLVAKGYQPAVSLFGIYSVFWIFGIIAFSGVLFIYFYVPETSGKTLEELHNNVDENEVEETPLNDVAQCEK